MKIIYTWPWFLNSYISTLILFLHSPFAAGFGLTQHCGQFLNFSSKRHSFNWIQSSVDSLNYLSSLGGDGVTLIPTRLLLIHLYKRLYQIGRHATVKTANMRKSYKMSLSVCSDPLYQQPTVLFLTVSRIIRLVFLLLLFSAATAGGPLRRDSHHAQWKKLIWILQWQL